VLAYIIRFCLLLILCCYIYFYLSKISNWKI